MRDVFISFSSNETDQANRICNFLEENGHPCFISTRDIVPGNEYAEQLISNMDNCHVVVLLLSEASNASPHVLREVEYAVSHRIPILVYPLEEVTLSKSMEYFLMTHQWVVAKHFREQALLAGVKGLVATHIEQTKSEEEAANTRPATRKSKLLLVIIVVLLLVVLLLAHALFREKEKNTPTNHVTSDPEPEPIVYELGETLTFGSLYQTPIEWRVLRINDDGTLTLVSKYLLSMKPYDSPEGGKLNYYDGVDYGTRETYYVTDQELIAKIRGNNEWPQSNLRTWLNSDKEVVYYPDQAPTYEVIGINFYASAPGFLYEFTEEEKAAMVTVSVKSPANVLSGNAVNGIVTSEDLVYILSSEELSWFTEAGMHPYAAPNEACLAHDDYRDSYYTEIQYLHTENYYWWLRDHGGSDVNKLYVATTDHETDLFIEQPCVHSEMGVRPVITVDPTKLPQ